MCLYILLTPLTWKLIRHVRCQKKDDLITEFGKCVSWSYMIEIQRKKKNYSYIIGYLTSLIINHFAGYDSFGSFKHRTSDTCQGDKLALKIYIKRKKFIIRKLFMVFSFSIANFFLICKNWAKLNFMRIWAVVRFL